MSLKFREKIDRIMVAKLFEKFMLSKRIARFIIKYRFLIIALLVIATAFFIYQFRNFRFTSNFGDLLPQRHPYVKIHNKFREQFGGANLTMIEVCVKEGDIFNAKTLGKISRITEEIMFVPGVDRYKVFSIAHRKVKVIKATEWGIEIKPLMWPDIPESEEKIEELKEDVFSDDMIYGPLVSLDNKAALIIADLYERELDYGIIFKKIEEICSSEIDSNTSIHLSGNPILYGFIYENFEDMLYIFLITVLVMIIVLYSYGRKYCEVIIPMISATLCAIWGLGFTALIGYNLDPLIIVVPLLLSARVLSHSVQLIERFFEEYKKHRETVSSSEACIEALFFPGLAGIVTDAAGIFVIYMIPIPMLQKLAVICFFWAIFTIFMVLFLNPILLLYLHAPNLEKIEGEGKAGILSRIFDRLGDLSYGKKGWAVLGIAGIITLFAFIATSKLTIGEARPGSPLLWPDSRYNLDAKSINENFFGTDPLIIVVEGDTYDAIKKPNVCKKMEAYQRYMEEIPEVGGTKSIIDLTKVTNMVFREGDPKWKILPNTLNEIGILYLMYISGGEPGDIDIFTTHDTRSAPITVFCKDHQSRTIDCVIERTKKFVNSNTIEGASIKMAGGTIGVLAATNESLLVYQVALLLVALIVTALLCDFFLYSFTAGIILIIPLAISNFIVFAYMAIRGIGININTLPVASIAIGIGVDYGVYLFGRIREEYKVHQDMRKSIDIAIKTTGKAVSFTAVTIILGVIFWYFSSIRFQAEMGLLLALATFFHLIGTLIFLPALLAKLRPKFIWHELK